MKITKTEFHMDVNAGSSWKLYLFRKGDEANQQAMYATLMTACPFSEKDGGYWHVSGCPVMSDCRVPEFFHGDQYYLICVEHNQGDWNKPFTYELYIVE